MVIKLYISGISGNKEVKKKQQRVQMILDSKQINYEAIDITEPGKEKDKEFMQQNGKVRESLGKHPLPPQIFNDEDFCGDYEDFDMANEVDELEKFLHIATNTKELENGSKFIEDTRSLNDATYDCDKCSKASSYDPYDYHTFKIKWNGVNGLEEEIINTDNLTEESEKGEENPKSEVNGESEAVPASEPSNENIAESKSETSTEEVPAPAKEEEVSAEEKKTVEGDENVTENQETGVEAEEDTKRVEEEESEVPKEESETEKANEEESPHAEGDDVEENLGNENEGEEEKQEEEEEEKKEEAEEKGEEEEEETEAEAEAEEKAEAEEEEEGDEE